MRRKHPPKGHLSCGPRPCRPAQVTALIPPNGERGRRPNSAANRYPPPFATLRFPTASRSFAVSATIVRAARVKKSSSKVSSLSV
jgi:hypothetical protein